MSNAGLRIFTKINRPSKELLDSFANLPVANIADNMHRMSCIAGNIRPVNDVPLLGCAFTVKARPGDNLLLHKALDLAEPGDIIVVDAQGHLCNALMGELMALWAKGRGIGGFIIDGAVRDRGALKQLDLPIYAAGFTPAGPYHDGPGEINVPVSCGGVVVHPGDILVGDEDGIVVIRPQDAPEILEQAKAVYMKEHKIMEDIKNQTWDRTWIDKTLTQKGGVCIATNHPSNPKLEHI
jgi:RraA family protein